MQDHRIYIIKTKTGISVEEADKIFLRDNERIFQDFLKRKAHADFIMEQNHKLRKKT